MIGKFRYWPVIIALVAAAAGVWFILRSSKVASPAPVFYQPKLHMYKNPAVSVADVRLKVFYAVPKNRVAQAPADWQEGIKSVLEDAVKFHNLQFRGFSHIHSEIYPQPVVLKNDNLFYDTQSTNRGNPEALKRIPPELERRFPDFLKVANNQFLAVYIIYEGVGASGSPGIALLSRTFLSDPQYAAIRSSLFYHEFGHTLGLPDWYDLVTNQPYSNGIMASGRRKPITVTYIDRELLNEMGVIPQ